MDKPWEIVKKFQQQMPTGRQDKLGVGQGRAVHHFLPTNGLPDVALRIQKVRNLVDESTRIANESRPQTLNNTTVSFCQNCNCENCLNQSSILGPPENTINIPNLVQSFEVFLNTQRQQFMQMINQFKSVLDSSASSVSCHQGDAMKSIFPAPELTLMECDSSEKSKPIGDATSISISSHNSPSKSKAQGAQKEMLSSLCESPSSTKITDDDASSTSTLLVKETEINEETHNFMQSGIPDSEESVLSKVKPISDGNLNPKEFSSRESSNSFSSGCSFLENEDISFKPLRKSSFNRMRDSIDEDWQKTFQIEESPKLGRKEAIVVVKKLNSIKLPGKTKLDSIDGHEAADSLNHLTQNKVPSTVSKFRVTADSEATLPVCRTRSGRTVEKPRPYWLGNTQDQKSLAKYQEIFPKTKSGNKKGGPRKKSTAQDIPATNLGLESHKSRKVGGTTAKSKPKGKTPALNNKELKNLTNVITKGPQKSVILVSNQSIEKTKTAGPREKKSKVDTEAERRKKYREAKVQPLHLSLVANSATESDTEISSTNELLLREDIDQNLTKGSSATRKGNKTRSLKKIPLHKEDNKIKSSDHNKQVEKGKRKNQANAVTNRTSKRQKTMANVTRKLSTDSTEPDYECYFRDEHTDSWLET